MLCGVLVIISRLAEICSLPYGRPITYGEEVQALKDEIDRISESTNFNGIQLLDGSLSTGTLPDVEITGVNPTITAATGGTATLGYTAPTTNLDDGDTLTPTITYTDANGNAQKAELKLTYNTSAGTHTLTTAGGTVMSFTAAPNDAQLAEAFAKAMSEDTNLSAAFNINTNGANVTLTSKATGADAKTELLKVDNSFTTDADVGGSITPTGVAAGENEKSTYDFGAGYTVGDVFTVNGQKFAFAQAADVAAGKFTDDVNLVIVAAGTVANTDVQAMRDVIANKTGLEVEYNAAANTSLTFVASNDNGGLTLQIGDTADDFNQMTISVGAMDTKSLGIANIDVSTQAGAKAAVDIIKDAINKVSSTRGDLGAIQNRLEHTINKRLRCHSSECIIRKTALRAYCSWRHCFAHEWIKQKAALNDFSGMDSCLFPETEVLTFVLSAQYYEKNLKFLCVLTWWHKKSIIWAEYYYQI